MIAYLVTQRDNVDVIYQSRTLYLAEEFCYNNGFTNDTHRILETVVDTNNIVLRVIRDYYIIPDFEKYR